MISNVVRQRLAPCRPSLAASAAPGAVPIGRLESLSKLFLLRARGRQRVADLDHQCQKLGEVEILVEHLLADERLELILLELDDDDGA